MPAQVQSRHTRLAVSRHGVRVVFHVLYITTLLISYLVLYIVVPNTCPSRTASPSCQPCFLIRPPPRAPSSYPPPRTVLRSRCPLTKTRAVSFSLDDPKSPTGTYGTARAGCHPLLPLPPSHSDGETQQRCSHDPAAKEYTSLDWRRREDQYQVEQPPLPPRWDFRPLSPTIRGSGVREHYGGARDVGEVVHRVQASARVVSREKDDALEVMLQARGGET